MKTRITLKDFGALSFDAGQLTAGARPANLNPPPRLRPESVRDFNVQHDGSAEAGSPSEERAVTTRHCEGRDVTGPQRVMPGRWLLMTPARRVPAQNELEGIKFMKQKVLLVRDDSEALRSLDNLFTGESYEVVTTTSAQRAIDESDAGQIDLLVMQLDLRTGEGWEVIGEISEENPFLPIIVVASRPGLRELAEAAGARALVEEPVDGPRLLQTIRELLAEPVERRMRHASQPHADFRHVPPAGENFRTLLDRRSTTPYRYVSETRGWGINE